MDPGDRRARRPARGAGEPARRLHDPARHVLPPRGRPPRRRRGREPARRRARLLRLPRPGRSGLGGAHRRPARAGPRSLAEIGGPTVPVAALPHGDVHRRARAPARARATSSPAGAPSGRCCAPTCPRTPPRTPRSGAGMPPRPTALLDRAGWLDGGHTRRPRARGPPRRGRTGPASPGRGGGRPLPGVEPQARLRCPGLAGLAGRRRAARPRHRRLLLLQRPRHVAGDAPGRAARPTHLGRAGHGRGASRCSGPRRSTGPGRSGSATSSARSRSASAPTSSSSISTQPHLTPVHDVAALLVFAAGRGDVTDVLVDGELVVRDRRSTRVDAAALLAACRERGAVAGEAARGADRRGRWRDGLDGLVAAARVWCNTPVLQQGLLAEVRAGKGGA